MSTDENQIETTPTVDLLGEYMDEVKTSGLDPVDKLILREISKLNKSIATTIKFKPVRDKFHARAEKIKSLIWGKYEDRRVKDANQ